MIPGEQWPRAQLAVDLTAKAPIPMKAPTVIGGDDPYDSVQAFNNFVAAKALAGQVAPMDSSAQVPAPVKGKDQEVEVRRDEAARPMDAMPVQESAIPLSPPDPIQF